MADSQRYDELSVQSRSFAWEVDAQGLFTYVSDTVAHVCGYRPADLVGRRYFYELTPAEDAQDFKRHALAMIQSGEAMTNIENRLVRSDGELIWVEASGVPVTDTAGQVIGYRGLDKDVSDRKLAELELERYKDSLEQMVQERTKQLLESEKLAAIGTLAAGMGHEINNPVSYIMMNAQVLQEAWPVMANHIPDVSDFAAGVGNMGLRELIQRTPEVIRDILDGGKRIEAIVDNLRMYASHDTELERGPMDLNEAVQGVLYFCRHELSKSTRNFSVELHDAGLPVYSSLAHCEHVILNLLMNACYALDSPDQGLLIQSGIYRPGEYYVLVRDEGCGMDAETLQKITTPFFTTRRANGGTGLGLSVASHMAGELGGDWSLSPLWGRVPPSGLFCRLNLTEYVFWRTTGNCPECCIKGSFWEKPTE